jgi:hypothetical protein
MAITPLNPTDRKALVDEAQRLATQNGTDAASELWNYASHQGLSLSDVDQYMGFETGATDKWIRQKVASDPASNMNGAASSNPAAAAQQADYVAQQAMSEKSNAETGTQNLGFGSQQPTQQQPTQQQPTQQQPTQQQPTQRQGNPYLSQMGADIGTQMSNNFNRNVMPGIRSGAMAAGGFGGSRQGVVEANGINDLNQQYGSALTSLYGNAYNSDASNALGYAGLQNQSNIASMGNATTQRGQDQNYALGQGNLNLGFGNLANQQQQTANQYALGQGNLNLGFGNLDNSRQQTANTYALGQGQLANQWQSNANSYDLGLRSNDLGFAGLDANIAQNNFGNQLNAAQFGLNAYNTMGQQNNAATNAATTVQNQPLNYFNNAANQTNSVANGYGTQTSTQQNPGNTTLGFLGGAQMGSQIYKNYTSGNGNPDPSNAYGISLVQ